MVPTVTLDTNVLMQYWKKRPKFAVVERLLDLARNGHVDMAVTSLIHEDIERPPLADRINELPKLNVKEVGAVFRLGSAVLGRDRLADDSFAKFVAQVTSEFCSRSEKPPDRRDWDHVHTHYICKRDVFLTWDKKVLKAAHGFQSVHGVVLMKPEEFLKEWEQQIGPETGRTNEPVIGIHQERN